MILPSCLQQSKQQSSHELLQPYHTYHTLQAAVAMRSGVRLWDIIVQAKVPSWQVAWIQLMRVDLIIVHEHFCFLRSSISWYHDMIYFDMIWHLTSINYINCQLTSFYTIYFDIFNSHSPSFTYVQVFLPSVGPGPLWRQCLGVPDTFGWQSRVRMPGTNRMQIGWEFWMKTLDGLYDFALH